MSENTEELPSIKIFKNEKEHNEINLNVWEALDQMVFNIPAFQTIFKVQLISYQY